MTRIRVPLGKFIKEYSERNKGNEDIPVYSVTNSQGFCTEYFCKEVSSKLNISKKYSNGNPTTNWNFFKLKFGWKNLGNARKNWLQINGMEARSMEGDNNYLPKGHDKVDDIFDELCYTSTE